MYNNYRDANAYQARDDNQALLANQVRRYDTSTLDTEEALAIEKRKEIQEIEAGITDLAETQKMVSQLVQEGKPALEAADKNMDAAQVKVKDGINQLQQASKNQRASRKWMCCIIGLILIVVVVVVVIISVRK